MFNESLAVGRGEMNTIMITMSSIGIVNMRHLLRNDKPVVVYYYGSSECIQ